MRILFDNGTPRGIAEALLGHTIQEPLLNSEWVIWRHFDHCKERLT